MQNRLKILYNKLRHVSFSTEGFFDDNGECLFADEIIERVKKILGDQVVAIYLIGSVLKMKGKTKTYFLPHDIDIFVQTPEKYKLEKIGRLHILVNGRLYPVHWISYDCHPLEVYDLYDSLKLCFEYIQIYPRT